MENSKYKVGEPVKLSRGGTVRRAGVSAIPAVVAGAILVFMVFAAPRAFPQAVQAQLQQSIPMPPISVPIQNGALPEQQPILPQPASQPAVTGPGATSGTWTPLNNQPPFIARAIFLLTDGTILVQDSILTDAAWWKLTPDNTGSYVNGTWQRVASPPNCPNGYSPLSTVYSPQYYGSAVLPDGRFVMIGGEYDYNYTYVNGTGEVWTNQGAIYDPVANAWTCIQAPSGWNRIGDAESVVMPNGTFMVADPIISPGELATLNTTTNPPTFNPPFSPPGKSADQNYYNEEGWTLLPDGEVLTLEIWNPNDTFQTPGLTYDPLTQSWNSAGTAPNPLVLIKSGNTKYFEIGPATLRPNGTVFAEGATGFNDIYNIYAGTWTSGPTFPNIFDSLSNTREQLVAADAPAALLPDGNVLTVASPVDANYPTYGGWIPPAVFFEFDGTSLTQVAAPPRAPLDASYYWYLLPLPTGQILGTDSSSDVEIYTPAGTPKPAWAPAITSSPSEIEAGGANYQLTGTQFNGLSQASTYGDDYQAATNYPLVRITNNATGHVFYARTHSFSTMAVATGSTPVSAQFDVPAFIELGPSTITVVANGIPSQPVNVFVAVPQVAINVRGSGLSGSNSFPSCPNGTGDTCFLETVTGKIQKTINGLVSGGNLSVSLYADKSSALRGPLFGSCYPVQGTGSITSASATTALNFGVLGWVCDSSAPSSACMVGPLSLSIVPGSGNFVVAAGAGTFNALSPSCFSTPNDVQVAIKGVLTK